MSAKIYPADEKFVITEKSFWWFNKSWKRMKATVIEINSHLVYLDQNGS
jgi:hypothetical protein